MPTTSYSVKLSVYGGAVPLEIPHAFVTITAPGQPPVTVGYYPVVHMVAVPGIVKYDGAASIDTKTGQVIAHLSTRDKTFDSSPGQAQAMLSYAAGIANNPGDYGLLGNQCTGFARDVLTATANGLLSGLCSLSNLRNTLTHSGNTLGKLNATLSTLNYVNTSLPQLISGPGTAAFSPALNGFLNGTGTGAQGAFAGLGAGNVPGVLPVLGLIISIKNGDPIGTGSGNQRSPDPLGFQSYYTFDSCSRISHADYGHKALPKLAANDVEWRVAA